MMEEENPEESKENPFENPLRSNLLNIEFESVTKELMYIDLESQQDKELQKRGLLYNAHKCTPF